MSDGYYEYLMWRMSVCESAKELNKLTYVWPCSLTEDEISSLEEGKRPPPQYHRPERGGTNP